MIPAVPAFVPGGPELLIILFILLLLGVPALLVAGFVVLLVLRRGDEKPAPADETAPEPGEDARERIDELEREVAELQQKLDDERETQSGTE